VLEMKKDSSGPAINREPPVPRSTARSGINNQPFTTAAPAHPPHLQGRLCGRLLREPHFSSIGEADWATLPS
jgi:hypothetical protein